MIQAVLSIYARHRFLRFRQTPRGPGRGLAASPQDRPVGNQLPRHQRLFSLSTGVNAVSNAAKSVFRKKNNQIVVTVKSNYKLYLSTPGISPSQSTPPFL